MGTKIVSVDTLDAIAENAFNYIGENKLDINRIAQFLTQSEDSSSRQFTNGKKTNGKRFLMIV